MKQSLIIVALFLISGLGFFGKAHNRISHSVLPPPDSAAPFDLVWDSVDLNGIPKNPLWGWQKTGGSPPEVEDLCLDRDLDFGPHNDPKPFRHPGCTTQKPPLDEVEWWRNFYECGAGTTTPSWMMQASGHVNWNVATYEGWVFWESHSTFDDDYNFRLCTKGQAGAYRGEGETIGLEFKAKETVNQFSDWWAKFRDQVGTDNEAAKEMVRGKYAIVTGLIGLDGVHDFHAELHPVWAMAIHVNDAAADDTWAIFVRNWGNEGECSKQSHWLRLPALPSDSSLGTYYFLLPWRPNSSSVSLSSNTKFCLNYAGTGPTLSYVPGQGVLVRFSLPGPEKRPRLNGELHLNWSSEQAGPSDEKSPCDLGGQGPAIAHLEGGPRAKINRALRASQEEPDDRLAVLLRRMTPEQRARYAAYLEVSEKGNGITSAALATSQRTLRLQMQKLNANLPEEDFESFSRLIQHGTGSVTTFDNTCLPLAAGAIAPLTSLPAAPGQPPRVDAVRDRALELEIERRNDALQYALGGRIPAAARSQVQPRRRGVQRNNR